VHHILVSEGRFDIDLHVLPLIEAPPARLPLQPTPHHQNENSCNWPGGVASAGQHFFVVIFEGHLKPYRSQGGLSRYGSARVDARWTGDHITPPFGSGASMNLSLVDTIPWWTAEIIFC
jgi:hypothetical protein